MLLRIAKLLSKKKRIQVSSLSSVGPRVDEDLDTVDDEWRKTSSSGGM